MGLAGRQTERGTVTEVVEFWFVGMAAAAACKGPITIYTFHIHVDGIGLIWLSPVTICTRIEVCYKL